MLKNEENIFVFASFTQCAKYGYLVLDGWYVLCTLATAKFLKQNTVILNPRLLKSNHLHKEQLSGATSTISPLIYGGDLSTGGTSMQMRSATKAF